MKRVLIIALLAAIASPALADNVCPFISETGKEALLLDEHSNAMTTFLAGEAPRECEIGFLFGTEQLAACDGMAFMFSVGPAAPGEAPVLLIGDKSTGPEPGSAWREACDFDPASLGQG